MNSLLSGTRAGLGALVVAIALTGCGIPLQDSAQPLPSEVVAPPPAPSVSPSSPTSASPAPTNSPSPDPTTQVPEFSSMFFVRDDGLAAVSTELLPPVVPESVVNALVTGPPAGSGLRSVAVDPLTGLSLIAISLESAQNVTGTDVTVILASQFSALPPNEQVLLLGQVVLSLSSAGWPSVSFVDSAGALVAVPTPDGRLLVRPVVAGDYASLITEL